MLQGKPGLFYSVKQIYDTNLWCMRILFPADVSHHLRQDPTIINFDGKRIPAQAT